MTSQTIEERAASEWARLTATLQAAYQAKLFVLMAGPPGTGKTSAADTLGWWARVEHLPVTMSANLFAQQVIGQQMPGEDGRWRFQEGPISSAFLHGRVLSLNEIDRTPDGIASTLYGVLDDESVARLVLPPDRVCRRHKHFFCLATTNVPLGELSLPEPLLDRFPVQLAVGLPNPAAVRSLASQTLQRVAWDCYDGSNPYYRRISFRQIKAIDRLLGLLQDRELAVRSVLRDADAATLVLSTLALAAAWSRVGDLGTREEERCFRTP